MFASALIRKNNAERSEVYNYFFQSHSAPKIPIAREENALPHRRAHTYHRDDESQNPILLYLHDCRKHAAHTH